MFTDEQLKEQGLDRDQYNEIQGFFRFQGRLKHFKAKCTLATFQDIFGSTEGERLFQHYRSNEYDFTRFNTYLTTEDRNKFVIYIINKYDIQ